MVWTFKDRERKGGKNWRQDMSGEQTVAVTVNEWWQQMTVVTRGEEKEQEGGDGQRQSRKLKYM